jgi:HD-GYP domain-containing protein (c-di-GMP phosphodiesterase class II)
MLSTIAVEKLRVGMYVHLEGGWLSHPFPRSAFRIGSDDQLATLRGLGLKQVRWSPEKSDPVAVAPEGAPGTAAPASTAHVEPAPAADPELIERRRALEAQRAAVQRCERQYGEAARSWREATASLSSRPDAALQCSAALAQGMLNELLVESDIAIRLVNGAGGDRAAAHALNVSVMSMLIGRTLKLPEEDLLDLGVGALMHDIGKFELPERLRHPDEGFSAAEISGYRDHVARGVAQGRRLGLSPGALAVLAQHHEHADGSGFPQRLTGDKMSQPARIVAIVNRYDNLCNPPARVHPLTPHEAVSMLFAQGRNRFDATVLSAFIRMMGVYPAGSLVQLTDDRYAMVVGVNSSRPLKPRVLVHDPKVPRAEALLLNLEDTPDLGIRRSLVASKLPPATLEYLDPRPRVAYYFEALSAPAPRTEPSA